MLISTFMYDNDNIYRRPNVLEILQKCKTFTRWRMTDEVKEILSDIKEPKKVPQLTL